MRSSPREILFVADAMTGQEAVNVAGGFNDRLDITGVVLTKLDGDAKGGAALSIKAVTGKPVKFVGLGEKLDALEVFHADRLVSRILGMGDVLTLVEKAQSVFDEKETAKLQQKLKKSQFDLDDFRNQLRQLKKMGSLESLMGMIPGNGQDDEADAGCPAEREGSGPDRGDHQLYDREGAGRSWHYQRQPPLAHCQGKRHVRAGGEPAAEAFYRGTEDDEAAPEARAQRAHEGHGEGDVTLLIYWIERKTLTRS